MSAALNGESEVFAIVAKTQAVDLNFMKDCLKVLRLPLKKIESERNVSDLWTKCVSEKTLKALCAAIGRSSNQPSQSAKQRATPNL